MKIIIALVGLFLLYAQYHYVYVHGHDADGFVYLSMFIGIVMVLFSIIKIKPLK